ncbi:GGDEF domain-containing protein [Aliamphritea spongicola]|nr:GGDEF domain-containing protein [Aliamphritea spongicola]
MMGTFHDITELQESQQQLKFLAYNDLLTGLPNRTYFNEKLNQAISLANREEYQVALLFLDLDNFKDINDSFGHIAGDAVLKETACRIHTCLRAEDSISRMGGDEFIIIMEAVHSTASISYVADKILQVLKKPFCIADNHISISASIGISIYPDNGLTQNDLLTNADTALYRAKTKAETITSSIKKA